jgi:LmbE family N-acetylglucosaminyl deacetylase
MRWIYISPHLDDAVLSAGGLIYEQTRAGMDVEIWTFMCGYPSDEELSPFAQVLHHEWGISTAAEVVTARRAEDVHAARIVGAKTVHFDYLDCIYRRGKNGEWLYSDVFVPPHQDEQELPARIAETISLYLKADDMLVCQLALGPHLDHVTVRRAVELLKRPVLYDVDIPYLFNFPEELSWLTAGMVASVHPVSEAGLAIWQDAITAYISQIGTLFESQQEMRSKILEYWAENGGIRLWNFA